MKVLVIQHVEFETPGSFLDLFKEYSAEVTILHPYKTGMALAQTDIDLLLIMGGPMSIYDEDKHPWLFEEKRLIALAIRENKMIIGICLGAQLIADSLGVRIYKNPGREIGWFPVKKTYGNPLEFLPDYATVFHWHGETFDLPEGSTGLYSSDITPNQAFIYDNRVLALQFHLEMESPGIESICLNCREEIDGSEFVMNEEEMKDLWPVYAPANKRILRNLLYWLLKKNGLA